MTPNFVRSYVSNLKFLIVTELRVRSQRPDQLSLRRFSLAMGSILGSYALAGISFQENAIINLFGIPLHIERPQLLPYVLVFAAIYGLIRYYYYGVLASKSPYSARRELMDRLIRRGNRNDGLSYVQLHSHGTYFGPIEFELGPQMLWMQQRGQSYGEGEPLRKRPEFWAVTRDSNGQIVPPIEITKFKADLEELFPKFAGARVLTRWSCERFEPPEQVLLHVMIPIRCRLAALLEDLDYLSPIFLNILALAAFAWNRFDYEFVNNLFRF